MSEKCPCCKGKGKLDVPTKPNQAMLMFGALPSADDITGGKSFRGSFEIRTLDAKVKYLMKMMQYLTSMIENPVCPHCGGTGTEAQR